MRTRFAVTVLASIALSGFSGTNLCWKTTAAAQQPVTIRAGTILDGKGGVQRNAVIAVEGSLIVKLSNSSSEALTYDLSRFTALPGLIDTHVHIGAHFGKDGRPSNVGETAVDAALAAAPKAYT